MNTRAGNKKKQQTTDRDEAPREQVPTISLSEPTSSSPPFQIASIQQKKRTSRPGGSAKYIRKLKKGRCQYASRQTNEGKHKGELCGRIGTIREDGSCTCWYHYNRGNRLDRLWLARLQMSIQFPERLEKMKQLIQASTPISKTTQLT